MPFTSEEKPKLLILGPLRAYRAGDAVSPGKILGEKLEDAGYKVLTASHSPNRYVRLMDILISMMVWKKNYDVVINLVFSGRAFLITEFVSCLSRLIKKPIILWLHGGNLPEFSKKNPKRVISTLGKADAVICPSPYLKKALSGFRPDIEIIPNPINVSGHDFVLRVLPEERLVWLRAFHEIYNPCLAPKVVNLLIKDFPNLKLIMVGPDKGDRSYERALETANRLDVIDKIEVPGLIPKDEVPQWLNKGDIFLNTTNVDNTPVSVIEAMACGLCVVSTDVGGIPYLLEDGVDALLVPPDDPEAMAGAVRRILTDRELAARLSANARKKAESFSWDTILPMWERLIQNVLDQRKSGNNGK